MKNLLRRLWGIQPDGFILYRNDGKRHNVIRGDLIPLNAKVIFCDGRHFVNTGENSTDYPGDWRLYVEDHSTFVYVS